MVEHAAQSESFVIAKTGKPMVKVVPLEASGPEQQQRLVFLKGQFLVPEDFDKMGADLIDALFNDSSMLKV